MGINIKGSALFKAGFCVYAGVAACKIFFGVIDHLCERYLNKKKGEEDEKNSL